MPDAAYKSFVFILQEKIFIDKNVSAQRSSSDMVFGWPLDQNVRNADTERKEK